ncbi:DUF58 domain-containing protein [Agaribacterium haliotis]|uniref:DUF58 domain-containing protein n=1 Tax=Agaribacterium haliotis TaxID=2013869 RepID=UPI000BB5972C|nr:DUF58 domain-containing protein [Agaribacterium haliotis]
MLPTLTHSLRQRFANFAARRVQASLEHKLTQRNLFVFPPWRGLGFLGFLLALWLLGTNYQNNLILALSFLMASVFVFAILASYANMQGLSLVYLGHREVFAGGRVQLKFRLSHRRGHGADGLELAWQNQLDNPLLLTLEAGQELEFELDIVAAKRGLIALPPLRVQTVYPLGIVRCWTWLRWSARVLVFPKPERGAIAQAQLEALSGQGQSQVTGHEDFNGLAVYQAGAPTRRIAWKAYARGRGLWLKDFSQELSAENWLDYDAVQASSAERRLSVLSERTVVLSAQGEAFGLRLPGVTIPPATGVAHRKQCLEALARFAPTRVGHSG